MSFVESNTVEQMILDASTRREGGPAFMREHRSVYGGPGGPELRPADRDSLPAAQPDSANEAIRYPRPRISLGLLEACL